MTEDEPKKPFWGQCGKCQHCFIVAYYPIELGLFAKIALRHCICPMCGDTNIIVARQVDGLLTEPQQSSTASAK